jgi:ribosomal protein L17
MGGIYEHYCITFSYTRIVKIGLRKGDAAMEVLLELV